MTYSIVLQITWPDLNSVQLSIAFKDGDLWRLHGRIPSCWTSSGCFHCIVVLSKSGAGEKAMRTTPRVALWGGKPRRKYFNSLHLTTWTDDAEPTIYFILGLYRMITSSAVLLKSQRLWGIFWRDSRPFSHRFEVFSRANSLRYRNMHIQDASRLSRLPGTWECPRSLYWMFLASCTIRKRLDPKHRAGKWEKVNNAEYPRTSTRGPATTCMGFHASEGQLKVRRLVSSAIVDSCLNYIVESCILRARYMFSKSSSCDIFATLTQDIFTCPSCRLERLLFVCNLAHVEGQSS